MATQIWSSDSSSEEDNVVIATTAAAVFSLEALTSSEQRAANYTKEAKWGGSRPGRRMYRARKRLQGAVNIDRDYFCRMTVNSLKTPLMEDDF